MGDSPGDEGQGDPKLKLVVGTFFRHNLGL